MNHEDTLAAGLLAGYAHGLELQKLSSQYLIEKLGGEEAVAKSFGQKALSIFKQYGNNAVNTAVGATVGTIVGKSIGKADTKKPDLEIATAAPNIFRAGYEEGLRRGLENRSGGSK